MSSLVITTIIFLIVLFKFCIPELKKKNMKSFYIHMSFLVPGYILLVFSSFNIDIPSPFRAIEDFIRFAFKID